MLRLTTLALALFLPACAVLQQVVQAPDVRVTNMGLEKAGLFEQVLKFELELDNPNPIGLPLAGMNYTLELGGVELGTGEQLEPLMLPANGMAKWPVTFRVNSLRLAQGFLERGSFSDLDYRIHGAFRLSETSTLSNIPFDRRGKIASAAK